MRISDWSSDVCSSDLFAAERAWLLIRMGEPVVARSLIQDVDTGNYTPKLLQVAMQAALATGDPAGLCPLGDVIDRYDDHTADRKSVVEGKSVSVRVDIGGRRLIKNTTV